MTDQPTRSDDDVRHLLDADTSEPSAQLDADIRAAARKALTSGGGGRDSAFRPRWRIPAVIGAAATVLLAVVVVEQMPQPAPEAVSDAVEESAPVTSAPSRAPATQIPQSRFKFRRELEESVSARAAGLTTDQDCSGPGNALSAGEVRVCVMEDHFEVRDAAGDCGDALRLKRDGGEVSLGDTEGGLDILVDGETVWQVRCVDGVWELEER